MTWVKLDDGFPDHPKVTGLSDRAFRWSIKGLCYVSRFLTDGVLPASFLKLVPKPVRDELTAARLWQDGPDGDMEIHDYLGHQRSRAVVEKERARNRNRFRPCTAGTTAVQKPIVPPVHTVGVPQPESETESETDPERTTTTTQMTTQPRKFDRQHAGHVFGFCAFKCLSEEKIQTFAKDLPGGADDPENFERVLTWATRLRETWGDKPKAEFEWFKFWEARWKERLVDFTPKVDLDKFRPKGA